MNKGKINEATFSSEVTPQLREALRTITPEQLRAVAREAVLQAHPGATEKEVAALTGQAMRELNSVASTEMTRELQGFIVGKIKAGAENFRSVANDPQKLQSMLQHLQGLSNEARAQTLQSWGLEPSGGTPSAAQLSAALTQRAALMDASARTLEQTSGSDTLLYRLASYPGVAELFSKEKRLDPDSVAGRALAQVDRSANSEKNVRLVGDFVLGVTSAVAFGAAAAAVGATTAGAVAIAAPATLANTARKLGGEETAVNTARAGTSAGVMGQDAIAKAEAHQRNVAAFGAAETVAPAIGHLIGHAVHAAPAAQVAIEGGMAAGITGAEVAVAPHAHEKPTGRDATRTGGPR
ncbi:MAG: hypothetical protein SFW67_03995 [Myxococcaceae bacterium]|nr:hypothetical protein [Myxococcaceae bacterium]